MTRGRRSALTARGLTSGSRVAAGQTLNVSEIFGPTIQGEGPAAGQRATFVRLAGCPFRCTWCDTRYSWDARTWETGSEPTRRSVGDVVDVISDITSSDDLIVITGGEPLAQQAGLAELVDRLSTTRRRLHLETAGREGADRSLLESFETVVVSPKLSNAGHTAASRVPMNAFQVFADMETVWFKFVVRDGADLDEVAVFEKELGIRARVMIMAEGSSTDESLVRTRSIVDEVVARGWSMSPRLHIWLWGDERGR